MFERVHGKVEMIIPFVVQLMRDSGRELSVTFPEQRWRMTLPHK
jgi:hypothetical protein